MDWKELLGLIGGVLTTGSLIPQVWRLFKLKSAHEISLTFTFAYTLGTFLWLSYGIALGLIPIIFWNSIGIIVLFLMLYAKLKYGR